MDILRIRGACEHNLKNVSLDIPKNKLVVFTGVSGSGKSSLAFDTIYAEGQRRYVESLSSYARQFLGIMNKPDVESIEGLSPAVAIDQKSVTHNPRSTVGTITEIYDYMRLLFARIGHPFCPQCEREISKLSPEDIALRISASLHTWFHEDKIKPVRFMITASVVRKRKGEFTGLFANLRAKGFNNIIVDGKKHSLKEDLVLLKTNAHTIEVIIDSISLDYKNSKNPVFMSQLKSRIFVGVETALNLSDGLVAIIREKTTSIFSEKFSCPNCNISLPEIEPRMFSFNSPIGACEKCKGLGFITAIDPDLVLNKNLSINEGGIIPFASVFYHTTWYARLFQTFLQEEHIDRKIPIGELGEETIKKLLFGTHTSYHVYGTNRFGRETMIVEKFGGVIKELERRYFESESEYARQEIQKYMVEETCTSCQGKRLKPEVLSIRVNNKNIFELCNLSVSHIIDEINSVESNLNDYEKEVAHTILTEIRSRLAFLNNVGLSYLTLNRGARTLSGGEAQRIRLASQIGSGLTGVLYVLDEPSIGLHPKDVHALIMNLKKLRDLGNSIIVVEHDLETIMSADYIVDFGPFAGRHGGRVIYEGDVDHLKGASQSLTAQYVTGMRTIPPMTRKSSSKTFKDREYIMITDCRQYNLKNITARFPLNTLICVSGVSGSGKSTLVVETLYPALSNGIYGTHHVLPAPYGELHGQQYIDKVYLVDQSAIGRTPRSNPATYLGIFDHIRDLFAQTIDARSKGYKKGRFSFNVKGGRCEKCMGAGSIKIEMQFLPDVYVTCDVCMGKRYNSQTLEITYKGKNIYDILNFTVVEALDFFKNHPAIYNKLKTLQDVGLGYITLGQSAPTLSGGEAQRVKLAFELSRKDTGRTVYILDEPTTGLHLYDVEKLLTTLYKLIERGNTVIIIEHNIEVIRNCEYIIDLGPEGGEKGGNIIYQGPVQKIKTISNSYTGKFLAKHER